MGIPIGDQQKSRWDPLPVVESLKELARSEGLWNLFMPGAEGAGLSNVDYAYLCEEMGRSHLGPGTVQLLRA